MKTMTSKLSMSAWAVLLGLALQAPAQAHRTWLLPQTAHISSAGNAASRPAMVTVDAVASEELFEYEHAQQLGTVLILAPDGKAIAPEGSSSARHRNSIDIKLEQSGSYRICNSAESVFASYKLGGETKRWRGKPADMAAQIPAEAQELQVTQTLMRSETFVSKERATLPPFARQGQGLELQALSPVTDLSDGDSVHLRVLADGKPLAGADVTVLRGGSRYRYKLGEMSFKTDANGELRITWPEAGRYWLGLGHEVAAVKAEGDKAAQPAKRYRYSATFEVLPK
ncbi:DUF4198 domain-containing protein [Paucibacter sp. AS339]|uniref:DUF4198 domain-containing protein n=1 Tax=Paucibacter hankyongi TaxID=3133434 RepID=UPI003095E154